MGILDQQEDYSSEEYFEPQRGYDPTVMSPQIPEPNQEFFKFMIESLDIIEQVEMQLRGYAKVPDDAGQMKYVKKFKAWCNNKGINKIIYIIYSLGINKNTLLGNLDRDEINYKCMMAKKKLAFLLFKSYKEFEVDKNSRDLLIMTVVNTIHSGLSRCEDGKTSDEVTRIIQRHEIQQVRGDESSKNQFSINPFKNKF